MRTLLIVAMLAAPVAFETGCSKEVAHTEQTKTSSNGDTKTDAKTTYQNPDGSMTTVKTQSTNDANH
jgi:hypothetical protein